MLVGKHAYAVIKDEFKGKHIEWEILHLKFECPF